VLAGCFRAEPWSIPTMPAMAPVTAAGVAAGSESGDAFERSVAPR
jgi:hypothetical protein